MYKDVDSWERDYAAWVDGRGVALLKTAYLLCGDWHSAEDLTQTTLTKLYLAWRRIDRTRSVDGYARQALVRSYLDERRRPWRREHVAADPPDTPAPTPGPDDRLTLEAALRGLPKTQRAVLVLRYWSDLDVRATADALGISEGTVKSATSRGLAGLRDILEATR